MTTVSPAQRALAGRRVAVTRASDQGEELITLLRARGAIPVVAPTIEIQPPESFDPLDDALRGLPGYDWLVLTSANAARAFADRMESVGVTVPATLRIAVVGAATAHETRDRLRAPDFMPRTASAAALAAEIGDVDGTRVLFPHGDLAGTALPRGLRERGATVDEVVAYRTAPGAGAGELARLTRAGGVDAIVFMSGSSVRHFADALRVEAAGDAGGPFPAVVCIGPETAHAARDAMLDVSAVAATPSAAGVIDALEQWFGRDSNA